MAEVGGRALLPNEFKVCFVQTHSKTHVLSGQMLSRAGEFGGGWRRLAEVGGGWRRFAFFVDLSINCLFVIKMFKNKQKL